MFQRKLIILFFLTVIFSFIAFVNYGSIVSASTNTWDFSAATNYTYDNTKIEFSSGQAQLKSTGSPSWYNTSWKYRKKITVDYTKVASNLSSFPLLIDTTSDSNLASSALSSGYDILFTSSDGQTKLSHQVEKYTSSSGNLIAWVKTNLSSSSNTILYMYYGNSTASDQSDTANVWDSNYKLVQHLDEDPSGPAPQMIDSVTLPTSSNDYASSFTFSSRFASCGGIADGGSQGVTTDGTYIWCSSATQLKKYDKSGNLIASRSGVAVDQPVTKTQINGLYYKDGLIYATANNYSTSPNQAWVLVYDAATLDYITYHSIGSYWAEGCSYYSSSWWCIYHNSKNVSNYDTSWNHVADYDLSYSITPANSTSTGGYDGIAWIGNYLYVNIHEIYTEDFLDIYHWNGTSFTQTNRLARPTSQSTQGIVVDPTEANTMWWQERTYTATDNIVKSTINSSTYTLRNNGTSNGIMTTTDQTAGKIAGNLEFDGSNDYIDVGTGSQIDINGVLTLEAWVRPDASAPYSGIIGKNKGSNNTGYILSYDYGDNGKFTGWVGNGTTAYIAMGTTVATLGQYYHVVFVYDQTEVKIYVNGSWQDGQSDAFSGSIANTTNAGNIGRYQSTSTYKFNGAIDEVRISNTARTAQWIQTEYTNQNSPSTFISLDSQESVYSSTNPAIQGTSSSSVEFTSLSGFSETSTKNTGQIKYQISNDGGNTWYWFNSGWTSTVFGYAEASTASIIDTNIALFPLGSGIFLFKAYLHSDGTTLVQLDNLTLSYINDTTVPVLSVGSPSGTLAYGTTSATLSLTTDENATCKYGITSGTAYASIANTLTTTGGISHSASLTGLTNAKSYTYYVRCQDGQSNSNLTDYVISFSIAADYTVLTVSMTTPTNSVIVSDSTSSQSSSSVVTSSSSSSKSLTEETITLKFISENNETFINTIVVINGISYTTNTNGEVTFPKIKGKYSVKLISKSEEVFGEFAIDGNDKVITVNMKRINSKDQTTTIYLIIGMALIIISTYLFVLRRRKVKFSTNT